MEVFKKDIGVLEHGIIGLTYNVKKGDDNVK